MRTAFHKNSKQNPQCIDKCKIHTLFIFFQLLGFHVLRHKDVTHRSKRRAVDYVNKLKSDARVCHL